MDKRTATEELCNNSSNKAFSSNAKKKILSIVCAMMFSLTLMGVGVVAALSQFDVTIGNAISVEVLNVEASIFAKRIGGVDPAGDETAEAEDFNAGLSFYNNPIYTSEDNINEELKASLELPVNVNENSKSIQYVFMVKTDAGARTKTKISIDTYNDTYSHQDIDDAEISYKFCFTETEPADWTGAQNFPVNELARTGHLTSLIKEGSPIYVPSGTTVFIMAEFKLKHKPNITIDEDKTNPLLWDFEIFFEGTVEDKDLYTIEYVANGYDDVSNMPLTQAKYDADVIAISSMIPERVGYTFMGWATTVDGTAVAYAPGTAYVSEANLVLYAIWSRHTVIFDANGGTYASSGGTTQTLYAPHGGLVLGTPEEPTKEGFKFGGWYTSSTEQDSLHLFTLSYTTVTTDTRLYARWIAE